MSLLFLHLLLTLAWIALTGGFTATNFVIGFVLAIPVIWLSQRGETTFHYLIRVRRLAGFALFFLWDLVKANLRVARDVLTPRYHMRPCVIAVPLEMQSTDMEILVLTTLVALTPGTLSLDVSTDRRTFYIHAMYVDNVEQFREAIKQDYERRVREVLR